MDRVGYTKVQGRAFGEVIAAEVRSSSGYEELAAGRSCRGAVEEQLEWRQSDWKMYE